MISLCTFIKNEAHCLEHMLDSIIEHVSEFICVDTGSEDESLKIAANYGARIYRVEFTNFGEIRTLTAHIATQPWVLMLDADETLDNPEELYTHIIKPTSDAYALPRKRWLDLEMTKQTELEAYPDYQVRLYRNNKDFVWRRELHEYFDGTAVEHLQKPHINHFQDVFKDEARNKIRQELYERLAIKAGVTIHGGKEICSQE